MESHNSDMPKTFEGDEWKYQQEPREHIRRVKPLTRAERQADANQQYLEGKMSIQDWNEETDLISKLAHDGSILRQ